MTTLLIILHVFVSLFLILVVLLQTGQADMGTAFGSGSSSSVLGAGGSNKFMTRLTAVAATIFMLTSIGLTVVGTRGPSGSVVGDLSEPATPAAQAPAEPEAADAAAEPAVQGEAPPGETPAAGDAGAEGVPEAPAGEAAGQSAP